MSASHLHHATVAASLVAKLLLPDVDFLQLDGISVDEEEVLVVVTSVQDAACCPTCGRPAGREHSRYIRQPSDLPCVGRKLHLQINVRRFFCDNPDCERRTFAERLPGVVKAFARRTERLAELQRQIGLALGGEAGSRHAEQLSVPASPDTLLRLVNRYQEPTAATPRVLGIDDWAWRKRQRYGTILVDLERRCVVEILPDRSADTVAAWLQAHPGVEIISRDRGGIYADGARRGAPHAIQVADRFHLLLNLRETLERLMIRRHADLPMITKRDDPKRTLTVAHVDCGSSMSVGDQVPARDPLPAVLADASEPGQSPAGDAIPPARLTQDEQIRQERRGRRLARYQQVMEWHQQGMSLREIAHRMGIGRKTVRSYVSSGAFPEIAQRRPMPRILDRFEPYLTDRWLAGCHNGVQLYREMIDRGYTGSRPSVSRWVAERRRHEPNQRAACSSAPTSAVPKPRLPAVRRLSPAQAAWLLVQPPLDVTENEHAALDQMQSVARDISTAYTLAQDFIGLVHEHASERLNTWIERALSSGTAEMQSFAKGLQQDLAAVTAGISLPWSNGQTEGQVNRLKLIKRTMYGRAGFNLLRQRILVPT
jgi:transposase